MLTKQKSAIIMETKQKSLLSEIELTADGSHTLFVPSMDEHYHSVNGAKTEAEHIYINYGLRKSSAYPLHILEIGFGTGLNAYLTLLETQKLHRKTIYTSLELYPLSLEVIRQLNYPDVIYPEYANLYYDLHQAKWNEPCKITSDFTILKQNFDFTHITHPSDSEKWSMEIMNDQPIFYDVIYFDAFAPEKQPEMWNQELFNALYASTNHNGILMTYCAKGVVRRMLQSAGFTVERLPGPPGKREVLRANKQ